MQFELVGQRDTLVREMLRDYTVACLLELMLTVVVHYYPAGRKPLGVDAVSWRSFVTAFVDIKSVQLVSLFFGE